MNMRQIVPSETLGEVLMQARLRRGLTQEELGKDSGIGQAAIAKIERNRTVPKVTTLCRYLKALSLSPEEELDVWHQIRGRVKQIDWVERLGIDSYILAKKRAQVKLNSGDAYDAYGYIEVMTQLAADSSERAYAELLHANRFKDLGLYSLAEQYYNRATVSLGNATNPRTMTRILINLADLHIEQGRFTLADAYIVYALEREADETSRAFAYQVKGRIKAAQENHDARAEAIEWFTKAKEIYQTVPNELIREPGIAWSDFFIAEVRSRSNERRQAEMGLKGLRRLAADYGPADRPANPELFSRVTLILAELGGDVMMLNTAQRIAKKHGLRSVTQRIKSLRAIGWMALALFTISAALPSEGMALDSESGLFDDSDYRSDGDRQRERDSDYSGFSDSAPQAPEFDEAYRYVLPYFGYEAGAKDEPPPPQWSDNGQED